MAHVSRATLIVVANVTLAIDDEVLQRARIRALERGTSVNALVRDFIGAFAGAGEAEQGLREFVSSARASGARSGSSGRRWSREALYDERLGRRG